MKTKIEVQGTGRETGKPDKAVLTFSAATKADTTEAARKEQAATSVKINKALFGLGVVADDIIGSEIALSKSTKRVKDDYVPDGFVASSSITIRVRDLTLVSKMIDAGIAAGATNFDGPNLSIENTRPYKDRARKSAYADAVAKATLYAESAGLKLGKAIAIEEKPQDVRYGSASNVVRGGKGMIDDSEELAIGVIDIDVNLKVVFIAK